MISEAVDKLIAIVSPDRALQRKVARKLLEVERSGYDSARKTRYTNNWSASNRSADAEMLADADLSRARARDLVRNNAYARGVLRAQVRNVVGCGIRPQARVAFKNGKQREPLNKELESLFDRWQRRADITGRLTFYEMQELVYAEMKEAGEVLIRFVKSPDRSRVVPLALELIEADRLASDYLFPRGRNVDNGNEVRRGIELNSDGVPVAYHLYRRNPADVYTYNVTPVRVPAEQVIHLFKQERVGQTRGMTAFSPVVQWMRDLDQYVTTEMKSALVASCFSVAIKSVSGGADGGIAGLSQDDNAEMDGATFEQLKTGLVARLFPDEDIEVINPSRGHADQQTWVQLFQQAIAVGSGLSYERLTRDYSKTNFSSNRAGDLEDRKEFRIDQDFMVTHLCEPVWIQFVESAVAAGKLAPFTNSTELMMDFQGVTAHEWQPPGWEWVDPKNQATADQVALENRTTTIAEIYSQKGNKDWRDGMRQRAMEMSYWKELEEEFDLAGMTNEQAEAADVDEAGADDESDVVSVGASSEG